MLRLLILADGFTDALDTGVCSAACDIPTQVLTAKVHHPTEEDAEVFVIDTETRHLSPKEAGKITRALTENAMHTGVPCVYKKTDSVFRGNVGAELETALPGSDEFVPPLLPASPEFRRTTIGGRQHINGIPINESPFGKDPFGPVRTAETATLLGLQSSLLVENFPPLEANDTAPSERGTLIFNAGSEEELSTSDKALFRDTVLRVLAGCVKFAAYLPELLELGVRGDNNLPELSPRLLVFYGSVNPTIHRQLSVAADEGFGHMHLTPQEKVLPDFSAIVAGNAALQVLWEQLREHPHFIVNSSDTGNSTETRNYMKNLGLSLDELRFRVVNALGTVLAKFIEELALSTLLLTGGDTLLQYMNALGVRRVEPVGELGSGIALCRFLYRGKEHAVITKSGGFEEEDLLPRLTRFLGRKTEGGKR